MTTKNRAEVLAEVGVTPPEFALFVALYYGITVPPSSLPYAAEREHYDPTGPGVTEEECRLALADCLKKGWLQIIDERALRQIKQELQDGGYLGPVYRFPSLDGVDFTLVGAELWQRADRLWCHDAPFAYPKVVHSKSARFFRTESAAVAAMEEARKDEDVISVAGPTPIGPWRVQWWRRFPEGFRIDIEARTGQSWGVRGSCSVPSVPRDKADLPRLRHVLDCHNLTFAQWLLLAQMDQGGCMSPASLLTWTADSAQRSFGLTISEEEMRSALKECFSYGWMRMVDQAVLDEIEAVLRNDPTLQPIPDAVRRPWGEIDFTPSGATLYRMIAAEWLGADWEDALWAGKDCYWEEHHYCEVEAGFEGIVKKHEGMGAVVRESKVVPIGPWCVYWWERFPAGYRLELKVGEA